MEVAMGHSIGVLDMAGNSSFGKKEWTCLMFYLPTAFACDIREELCPVGRFGGKLLFI
jgi:hypothetical protein